MPPHIDDFSLGNRFWGQADLVTFAKTYQATSAAPAENKIDLDTLKTGKHDAAVMRFLSKGDAASVKNAINRAELFAAGHVLTDEQRTAEQQRVTSNAQKLGVDIDAMAQELFEHCENMDAALQRVGKRTHHFTQEILKTSLEKMLATAELTERAVSGAGALTDVGRLALKNAVIGLAGMLQGGMISKDAVLILADNDYYDTSRPADMLKLASKSAARVKEIFVDKAGVKNVLEECNRQLAALRGVVSQEKWDELMELSGAIFDKSNQLIAHREKAVSGISTDYRLTDQINKKKDKSFQEKELKNIRESLRAFRFDLDTLSGKKMGKMETVRRKMDNISRNSKDGHCISKEEFTQLQQDSADFTDALNAFKIKVMRLREGAEHVTDDFRMLTGGDLQEAMDQATELSHLTNERIRYYFSGAEQKELAQKQDVYDKVGDLFKRGGERKVTMEVGLDFMLKLNASFAKVNLDVGAKFKLEATLKVPTGGGELSVEYSYGGAVFAKAKAHAGAGEGLFTMGRGVNLDVLTAPDSKKTGLGAEVEAHAEGGLSSTTTQTYATLDDFIRDTKGDSLVMEDPFFKMVLGKIWKGVKKIGHLFTLGASVTGMRIHKSKSDTMAYIERLRHFRVFSSMDTIQEKKQNVILTSRRKALKNSFDVGVSAEGGYYKGGEGLGVSPSVNLSASANFEGTREFRVRHKTYQGFAKKILNYSAAGLNACFKQEVEKQLAEIGEDKAAPFGKYVDVLKSLVDDAKDRRTIGENLAKLPGLADEMEREAKGHDEKDAGFWTHFAKRCRLAIATTACLARKAKELEDPEERETMRKAVVASYEYLLERFSNPQVRIPRKVFEECLMQAKDFGAPPKVVRQGGISVGFAVPVEKVGIDALKPDLGGEVVDFVTGKKNQWGIAAEYALSGGVNKFVGHMGDAAVKATGLDTKVEGFVVYEKNVDGMKDARPWHNQSSLTVNVNITASMPIQVLVESIARMAVSRLGNGVPDDELRLFKNMKNDLIHTLKKAILPTVLSTGAPFLASTVGTLLVKSEGFRKFMYNAGVIGLQVLEKLAAGQVSIDFGSEHDVFKTLSARFENGRLACLSAAHGVSDSFKLGFNAFGPGMHFSFKVQQSTVEYAVFSSPSIDTMMGRVADLKGTGIREKVTQFLTDNKKGTLRLLKAFSQREEDMAVDGDEKFAVDRQETAQRLQEAQDILAELAEREDEIGAEAQGLREKLTEIARQAKEPNPEGTDEQALKVAQELFATMVDAFTLKAEAEAA